MANVNLNANSNVSSSSENSISGQLRSILDSGIKDNVTLSSSFKARPETKGPDISELCRNQLHGNKTYGIA